MVDSDGKDKAEDQSGPKDTMHSGPQAAPEGFDTTANAAARALAEERGDSNEPAQVGQGQEEQSSISVGEFKPEPGSTLVTDIKPNDPGESTVINPGNEPPPGPLARQPNESIEEAGKRIKSESKASSSRSKSSAKSSGSSK